MIIRRTSALDARFDPRIESADAHGGREPDAGFEHAPFPTAGSSAACRKQIPGMLENRDSLVAGKNAGNFWYCVASSPHKIDRLIDSHADATRKHANQRIVNNNNTLPY
jgi:hypothetical protein